MTAPDSRPIHDVIAEAAREELRQRLGGYVGSSWTLMSTEIAAAVVAACQQATVAQQAELVDGEVEADLSYDEDDGTPCPVSRALGPWREDPS